MLKIIFCQRAEREPYWGPLVPRATVMSSKQYILIYKSLNCRVNLLSTEIIRLQLKNFDRVTSCSA